MLTEVFGNQWTPRLTAGMGLVTQSHGLRHPQVVSPTLQETCSPARHTAHSLAAQRVGVPPSARLELVSGLSRGDRDAAPARRQARQSEAAL